MAKIAAKGTRVWLDEFALGGGVFGFSQDVSQETPEVEAFTDTGPRRVQADYDWRAALQGFFDGDSGEIDEDINSILQDGNTHYLAIFPNSGDEGTIGRDGAFALGDRSHAGRLAAAVGLEFEGNGNGRLARATILRNASISGTGAGTGRNLGTTDAGDLFVVTARVISGTFSDLQFDIQESSDDGAGDAYADVSGLDFTFSAVGVTQKSVTAATEAWKRINVDAFTGTSALLVVTAGKAA